MGGKEGKPHSLPQAAVVSGAALKGKEAFRQPVFLAHCPTTPGHGLPHSVLINQMTPPAPSTVPPHGALRPPSPGHTSGPAPRRLMWLMGYVRPTWCLKTRTLPIPKVQAFDSSSKLSVVICHMPGHLARTTIGHNPQVCSLPSLLARL